MDRTEPCAPYPHPCGMRRTEADLQALLSERPKFLSRALLRLERLRPVMGRPLAHPSSSAPTRSAPRPSATARLSYLAPSIPIAGSENQQVADRLRPLLISDRGIDFSDAIGDMSSRRVATDGEMPFLPRVRNRAPSARNIRALSCHAL